MRYSKNAGYGAGLINGVPFAGSGKIRIVGDSSTINIDMLKEVYSIDVDGQTRFFATVDAAINACTADAGDIIYVMPSHAETFTAAAGFALDVAGVSVIGLGVGNNRPVFTISSTDNSGTITMSGNNTALKNVVVVGNDDGLTNAVVITGNNCVADFEYQDTSAAIEAETGLRLDTADNFDVKIKYLGFIAGNACVRAIAIDDCDNGRLQVDFYGIASTAVVNFVDSLSTNINVKGYFYTSGTTNLSKDVVDTIGSSIWTVDAFDGAAGAPFSGGSGNAVAIGDLSTIASDVAIIKDNTGGTDSATTVLGANDADNQYSSTLVAANEDGSVLERLEQIQKVTHNGSGIVLAVNRSILDAIGTSGTVVTDSATSVLGAIGADNANNAFASTSVVANKDGSVLERLEQLEATVQKTISKVQTTPSGGADVLFTITGGPIHVVSIWGIVTTVLVGAANGTLQATTTDPATTTAMSTTVAIDNDAKGTSYIFLGPTGVLTPTTAGLAIIDDGSVTLTESQYIVPIGNINFLTSGAMTGAITWYMSYIPSPLAVVA